MLLVSGGGHAVGDRLCVCVCVCVYLLNACGCARGILIHILIFILSCHGNKQNDSALSNKCKRSRTPARNARLCVCVRVRVSERERETERMRDSVRESVCVCACVRLCVCL